MTDITYIKTVEQACDESVIIACERLLAMAKSGEVVSFIAVAEKPGGIWVELAGGVRDMFSQLGMMQMAVVGMQERLLGR